MRKLFLVCLLLVPFVARAALQLPLDDKLKALTLESLLAFNKAVQTKSFVSFHQQISALWREQITPEKLAEAFKPFIDQGLDISEITSSKPVFEKPPAIDSDGILVLKGNYPTRPMKISFELKYTYEHPAWKLVGINVKKMPSVEPTAKLPSEKELSALVRDSLLAFNKSVQAKSFASFHKQIALLWQKQTTPEKLEELFKPFIDQGLDISSISDVEPIFEEPPEVKSDGLLVLKGYFPSDPDKVRFQLKYIFEDAGWKLVGINVKV